jgi:hypothetical protein
VGGLLVSQVLTLFTTPVVYLYTDKLSHWIGSRRRERLPVGGGAAWPKARPVPRLRS